nr:amino acid adenylation domain-containing protein/thioester reductase domain-containing protein [uncultured bacterium]
MLAGVLGILRAGGAYVPLDPAAPAERIAFVLRDSGARVLLGEPALLDLAVGFEGVVLPLGGDAPLPEVDPGPWPEVPPEALAYVIYTSGSTGTPKGVMVHHGALANLAHAEVELHGFGPSTRLFSTLAVSFDASAGDIFPALLCGGALVLHPAPGELSAAEMLAFARRHGATRPASRWRSGATGWTSWRPRGTASRCRSPGRPAWEARACRWSGRGPGGGSAAGGPACSTTTAPPRPPSSSPRTRARRWRSATPFPAPCPSACRCPTRRDTSWTGTSARSRWVPWASSSWAACRSRAATWAGRG